MTDMNKPKLTSKGEELIHLYKKMARDGYNRTDGIFVSHAYNDVEIKAFSEYLIPIFKAHNITSVLDYGCGGTDWYSKEFNETGQSAVEVFGLKNAFHYEPATNLDERQKADCVTCFDVMEHIFISDVPTVLRDVFQYAKKMVVINSACYKAAALLPNGENAHVTVRPPMWWKGHIDCVALDFPDIQVLLFTSTEYKQVQVFDLYSASGWENSKTYETT